MSLATATVSVNRQAALKQLEPMLLRELERRALGVQTRASDLCPVDTGRLRASITTQVTVDQVGPVARIGSNVEYAIYVEMGTSRMEAQPFLRPALGVGGGAAAITRGSGFARPAHGLLGAAKGAIAEATGL